MPIWCGPRLWDIGLITRLASDQQPQTSLGPVSHGLDLSPSWSCTCSLGTTALLLNWHVLMLSWSGKLALHLGLAALLYHFGCKILVYSQFHTAGCVYIHWSNMFITQLANHMVVVSIQHGNKAQHCQLCHLSHHCHRDRRDRQPSWPGKLELCRYSTPQHSSSHRLQHTHNKCHFLPPPRTLRCN